MIILWWNILGYQQTALNSLLTTLPNRNFYHADHGSLILYCSRIWKKYENRQTDREQTGNSITEATLIPVDRRGERANIWYLHLAEARLTRQKLQDEISSFLIALSFCVRLMTFSLRIFLRFCSILFSSIIALIFFGLLGIWIAAYDCFNWAPTPTTFPISSHISSSSSRFLFLTIACVLTWNNKINTIYFW